MLRIYESCETRLTLALTTNLHISLRNLFGIVYGQFKYRHGLLSQCLLIPSGIVYHVISTLENSPGADIITNISSSSRLPRQHMVKRELQRSSKKFMNEVFVWRKNSHLLLVRTIVYADISYHRPMIALPRQIISQDHVGLVFVELPTYVYMLSV